MGVRIACGLCGLVLGLVGGSLVGMYLYCFLWGTGEPSDGCGVAGALMGPWPGAIIGLIAGMVIGRRISERR